jgi:hypothetical protein
MSKEFNPKTLEDLIKKVEDVEGLILGYIGNVERWGDERCFYIAICGLHEENGNVKKIWACDAKKFKTDDYYTAMKAMRLFSLGVEYMKSLAK